MKDNFESESNKIEYGIVDFSSDLTPEELAPDNTESTIDTGDVFYFVFNSPVNSQTSAREGLLF
jgi:hypothetical protein